MLRGNIKNNGPGSKARGPSQGVLLMMPAKVQQGLGQSSGFISAESACP
jgi:hypothetical protein